MESNELLYLSKADVEAAGVSMSQIVAALEEMFLEKGKGNVEMPPKPGIHTRPDVFIHAMPAYIPSLNSAGMKWVSGYPENPAKGLPYITGLLILNDPETGIPIAVMDCTWIIILDNYSIHSSHRTRIALASLGDKVRLHFLTPYCPDHNRIERVWRDLHDNITRNHRCRTMNELMKEVRAYLQTRQQALRHEYAKQCAA